MSRYGDLICYERVIDGDIEQTVSVTSFPILRAKKPFDYVRESLAPTEYEELDSRVIALEDKVANTEVSSIKTLSVDKISVLETRDSFCELLFVDSLNLYIDDATSESITDQLVLLYKQNNQTHMLSLSTGDLYSHISVKDNKIYYETLRSGWIRGE